MGFYQITYPCSLVNLIGNLISKSKLAQRKANFV